MYKDKKVVVVMPAYNASRTLQKTYSEIDFSLVDSVILVDDNSLDDTLNVAHELGVEHVIKHDENRGYGGNQKSCYNKAIQIGADIVIMLHPDYQYTPKLIPSMVSIIGNELYPVVFGSRILGKGALKGGMPMYKYIANRFLTLFQNLLINQKLSEYHTGFRAFSIDVLKDLDFQSYSDDFIFDNEMIVHIFNNGYEIAEITCPTKYFEEASSINFRRSMIYGIGVMKLSLQYFFSSKSK
jgi:glycosyltransferase involved in cell wall biosynthesis|tara:strand:- start:371 stop:1090 length:720 start_codon:yes stop_codon:yes gene_type:complete